MTGKRNITRVFW